MTIRTIEGEIVEKTTMAGCETCPSFAGVTSTVQPGGIIARIRSGKMERLIVMQPQREDEVFLDSINCKKGKIITFIDLVEGCEGHPNNADRE